MPVSTILQGGHNLAITGGTGAFLGVRGQLGAAPPVGARQASFTEDPANRRRNGVAGTWRWTAHLIPMSAPQVLTTATGPAVFHSDFSPVTAAQARQVRRGFDRAGYWPWTYRSRCRSWTAVSSGRNSTGQFPRCRDGEWSGCGSGQQYRMARSAGYVSSGLSGSGRHGSRNGFRAVERRLDCWNRGADRGSVSIMLTGQHGQAFGQRRQHGGLRACLQRQSQNPIRRELGICNLPDYIHQLGWIHQRARVELDIQEP